MNFLRIPLLLLLTCLSAYSADTNILTRFLPLNTNCTIKLFAADGGVWLELPNKTSKLNFPKSLSFHETQAWQLARLLDDFTTFALKLEEHNMKFFNKHLTTITVKDDTAKWARSFDATIYVPEDGRALLVLTSEKFGLPVVSEIFDYLEARKAIELIKLLPDMQRELTKAAPPK